MKILVAFFSASGTTARLANALADIVGADLYEIRPTEPYTEADLDWMNRRSRTTLEMKDKSCRPTVTGRVENMEQYDRIFVGFPIWSYAAPKVVHTFLEQYDLVGKEVIPFATSGGSGVDDACEDLRSSCPGAKLIVGRRFEKKATVKELEAWVESL